MLARLSEGRGAPVDEGSISRSIGLTADQSRRKLSLPVLPVYRVAVLGLQASAQLTMVVLGSAYHTEQTQLSESEARRQTADGPDGHTEPEEVTTEGGGREEDTGYGGRCRRRARVNS